MVADRTERRPLQAAVSAASLAAMLGIGACLGEPQLRIPALPALPVGQVESAELTPSADLGPMVDAFMRSLPYRNDAAWYDGLDQSLQRLAGVNRIQAPLPALLAALSDPDPATRRGAAIALAEISGYSWRVQPDGLAAALIPASRDSDARVRENAVRTLAVVRPFVSVEPALLVLLHDPDPRVRWAAVVTLSSWERSATMAARLADALEDTDPRVRIAAAYFYGFRADDRGIALPGILDRLRSADPATRRAAAEQVQFFPNAIDDATRQAMELALANTAGDNGAVVGGQAIWDGPSLCLPHGDFALGGLRAFDPEQKALDVLGEPDRIAGGWSEDDGGDYAIYRYGYRDLAVDIARDYVERLATTSSTVSAGRQLRVGLTREQVLTTVFGMAPTPDALAARRYSVGDCDQPYRDIYLYLDFDQAGVLRRMEMIGDSP